MTNLTESENARYKDEFTAARRLSAIQSVLGLEKSYSYDHGVQIRGCERRLQDLSQSLPQLEGGQPKYRLKKSSAVPLFVSRKMAGKTYILHPNSSFRICWDICNVLVVLYYALSVPFHTSFDSEDLLIPYFDDVCNVFFVLDMALNFRTAFIDHGILQTDPALIATNYLRAWFWIDLVATMPFSLFIDVYNTNKFARATRVAKLSRLIRVVKLIRLVKAFKVVDAMGELIGISPLLLRMGKVVLIMTMAWHWLACAYWFVCDLENFGETVFSSRDSHNFFSPPVELWCQSAEECPDDCVAAGLCPAKMSFKYSHCFFWAVEVTFGIGQDIRPTTELETNFVIFCILVGVIMFSVIIGQMTASLAALRVDHDFQDRKMQKIKDYLQRHRVPWHMKDRIYGYYRYMWFVK